MICFLKWENGASIAQYRAWKTQINFKSVGNCHIALTPETSFATTTPWI